MFHLFPSGHNPSTRDCFFIIDMFSRFPFSQLSFFGFTLFRIVLFPVYSLLRIVRFGVSLFQFFFFRTVLWQSLPFRICPLQFLFRIVLSSFPFFRIVLSQSCPSQYCPFSDVPFLDCKR